MAFNEFLLNKRTRLSWVAETSFGAGGNMATTGAVVGLNARIEPDFNQNWVEILGDGTAGRTIDGQEVGALDLPFTLNFTPVDMRFLKYLGYEFTSVETPAASGKYVHTGTLKNSIQSFKLEWAILHSTDVVVTLTGCTVLSATITFAKTSGEESLLQVSLRCQAKSVSIGSTVTTLASGTITRTPFHFRNIKITNNNIEQVEVNNGEIMIDQGIDVNDSRYCNSTLDREVGEFIPKVHRLTGRYNLNLKDSTVLTQWDTAGVIANCKLELIKDADDYMSFVLDGFRFNTPFPSTDYDSVTNTDIVWKCNKFNPIDGKDNLIW